MSLKSTQKVATNRQELVITIDADTFEQAVQKAYKQNVGKINVQGFRKGKAPRKIIEKFYGENVFYEDALNILYPDAVESAIEEAGIRFVDDKIDFDLVSLDKSGVEFKVTVTVMPEVELKQYKGLKAEKLKVKVAKSEIDEELKRMADRNARLITVEDRAVQSGDIAVIDFEGFQDGKPFQGGKGESYSLTIGSGQFIPGFEEQVIGHNVGDEFDVNVTFPEDYNSEELAGKPAVFKVKVNEIKFREVPAIDDEFAKDVSEFDTLEELRKDLKTKATDRKKQESDNDVENQLLEQLLENLTVELPDALIENRAKQDVEDFAYRLQMQGMDLKTYLQYTGGTIDELKDSMRPQAEKQVKIRLALEKIAELENIEITEDELNAEYEKLAGDYKVDLSKIKASIPEKELRQDLSVKKAVELLKDSAEITEVDKKTEKAENTEKAEKSENAEGDEEAKADAPAKKSATKKTASKKSAPKTEEN